MSDVLVDWFQTTGERLLLRHWFFQGFSEEMLRDAVEELLDMRRQCRRSVG